MSPASSRWTTPTSAWPGVSEPTTSSPSAFSRTAAMKSLDDRQRDVGFEQRETDFAQRFLDVVFGQARLATQLLHDAAKPLGQIVKHVLMGKRGWVRSGVPLEGPPKALM